MRDLRRGGQGFYERLLRRLRIRVDGPRRVSREFECLVLLTWGPLVLVGISESIADGRWEPLLLDPSVHARLLVTLPLLVAADAAVDLLTADALATLAEAKLVEDASRLRLVGEAFQRERDAPLIEVFLAACALLAGISALQDWGLVHLVSRGPGIAIRWYALVALPLVSFLFLRCLWRWAVWCRALARMARLPLRLVPEHADATGGLSFVQFPVMGFCLLAAALSSAMAGQWGAQVLLEGLTLEKFTTWCIVLAVVGTAVGIGPLLTFTPVLFAARGRARAEFDRFSLRYGRAFHARWIDGSGGPDDVLVGTPDISSFTDHISASKHARSMRVLAFSPMILKMLVLAVVLPLTPLLLVEVPVTTLLKALSGGAFGGVP